MFQFTDSRFTHMPFAAVRPDGGAEEFCCIPVSGLWKLYHFTGKKWKRIRTGLPEDATECAPCADFEDGIWKISFIAGGWKGDRRFRLYRMYGLHGEVMAQQFADVGFVHKNCVAYASRRGPLFLVEPCRRIILTFHGVEFLYRVSYDPFEPNRLLISGQYPGGEIFSWSYKPGLHQLHEIIADGVPAYKCAFFHDCYYAKRVAGFEERKIISASDVNLSPLPAEHFITETEELTYSMSGNGDFNEL